MSQETSGAQGADTEVFQIRYAERSLRLRDVFEDFDDLGAEDTDATMDYSFWVVRRGEQVTLVDTGYQVSDAVWLKEVEVLPPLDGLSELGIDPNDVSLLVLTHFHFDHIGFVSSFPNARLVCGQAEYDYWMGKKQRGELEGEFTTAELLQPIEDAAEAGRVDFLDSERKLPMGITAIPIGGHCPGELLVTVETEQGGVILAADAAHYGIQVERDWPFFTYTDMDEMLNGFALIRKLAAQSGWVVVPGHDPAVRERFPIYQNNPNITLLSGEEAK